MKRLLLGVLISCVSVSSVSCTLMSDALALTSGTLGTTLGAYIGGRKGYHRDAKKSRACVGAPLGAVAGASVVAGVCLLFDKKTALIAFSPVVPVALVSAGFGALCDAKFGFFK